jgi:hypothetical protein
MTPQLKAQLVIAKVSAFEGLSKCSAEEQMPLQFKLWSDGESDGWPTQVDP